MIRVGDLVARWIEVDPRDPTGESGVPARDVPFLVTAVRANPLRRDLDQYGIRLAGCPPTKPDGWWNAWYFRKVAATGTDARVGARRRVGA